MRRPGAGTPPDRDGRHIPAQFGRRLLTLLAAPCAVLVAACMLWLALAAQPAVAQVPDVPFTTSDDLAELGIQGYDQLNGDEEAPQEGSDEAPEEGTAPEEGSAEDGSGGEGTGGCETGGLLDLITGGLSLGDLVVGIMGCGFSIFFENTVGAGLTELGESLSNAAFELQVPEDGGELMSLYDDTVGKVKGALLVGVLILAVRMTLQPTSHTTQYAFLGGLPKILFVGLALAFFPDFVRMVAELSGGLAFETMSEAKLGGALSEMIATSQNGNDGASVLGYIGLIVMLCMGLLVMVTAVVRNMLFTVLFLVGPLALICFFMPGLAPVTYAWFRAVLACFVISLLFCVEALIGSWIASAPELVFGKAAEVVPIFNVLAVLLLFWIMWKTPFEVLKWAFQGHASPGGGAFSGMANSLKRASTKEFANFASSAVKGALGATVGGGAGAALASSAGRGGMASVVGSRVGKKAGQAALGFGGGGSPETSDSILASPGRDRGMRDDRPRARPDAIKDLADLSNNGSQQQTAQQQAPGQQAPRQQGSKQQPAQGAQRRSPQADAAKGQADVQSLLKTNRATLGASYGNATSMQGAAHAAAQASHAANSAYAANSGAGTQQSRPGIFGEGSSGLAQSAGTSAAGLAATGDGTGASDAYGTAAGHHSDAANYHGEQAEHFAGLAQSTGDPAKADHYGHLAGLHRTAADSQAIAADQAQELAGSYAAGGEGGVSAVNGLGPAGVAALASQATANADQVAVGAYSSTYDDALSARHAMADTKDAEAASLRKQATGDVPFSERVDLRSRAVQASQQAAGIRGSAHQYADGEAARQYGRQHAASVDGYASSAAHEVAESRASAALAAAPVEAQGHYDATRAAFESASTPEARTAAQTEMAAWDTGGTKRQDYIASAQKDAYNQEYTKVYEGITGRPVPRSASPKLSHAQVPTPGGAPHSEDALNPAPGTPSSGNVSGGKTEYGARGGRDAGGFRNAQREPNGLWVMRRTPK